MHAFDEPLHVGRPNIGDRAMLHRLLDDVLDSRWLTNGGPMVETLERRVEDLLGVRHCIATCNATVALEVLARALGLSGEIIVPSFTFVATAHAFRWLGLQPVFCDVLAGTHLLDPAKVEELVTPRTSAIVGVHLWGQTCDVTGLGQVAEEHGLRLIFDAAHAFASGNGRGPVGGHGDAEVFSLHATKFVNGFEGGLVTTDDDELAQRLRLGRNFGFADYDTVVQLGTNAKMSEMSAAMALTSINSLRHFLEVNRRNHAAYVDALGDVEGLRLLRFHPEANHQYVVVEIDPTTGRSRDELLYGLHDANVLARRYFHPGCHRMEPYLTDDPGAGARLRVTEELSDRVLVLPTGTAVGLEEVAMVSQIVRELLGR